MPRLRVFRSVCAALFAAVLVYGGVPAIADTHDKNTFSNTADSIINLLTSPATATPVRRPKPRPIAVTRPKPQPKPVIAVHAKPRPPVIAVHPKPKPKPQPRPVIAVRPKPQPKPVIAVRPKPQPKRVIAVQPKPIALVAKAKHKPVRVVAMNVRAKNQRARLRKAYKPAHGGRGIAIVRPWQGSIPDTYCDLPTGCATAAPLAPGAAAAGPASSNAK